MDSQPASNWRAAPAFNTIYNSLPDCVAAAVGEFQRRQRIQFVILRHQINPTWAMMPWAQYRSLAADHPAQPATIVFFGAFYEFRDLCLSFPPDLFAGAPSADSPEANDLIPVGESSGDLGPTPTPNPVEEAPTDIKEETAGADQTDTSDGAGSSTEEGGGDQQ